MQDYVKESFISRRTEIISKMLDNPDKYEIYPTTICFAELDDLYDELCCRSLALENLSTAQLLRDEGDQCKPM